MSGSDAWLVVGGGSSGGIVVRAARQLSSQEHPKKLATGARVKQVARVGDRLHYKLLEGEGPEEGWVSLKLREKELLQPCAEPATAPSSPAPEARGSQEATATGAPADLPRQQPGVAGAGGQPAWRQPPSGSGPASPQPSSAGAGPASSQPDGAASPEKRQPKQQQSRGEPLAVKQLSAAEALQLQDSLRSGFRASGFQERLHKLQRKYPERKQRGHAHGTAYFEAFEALVMTVFARVLPKYDLQGNWDGVQDLHARMATASRNSKVKKQQEELNSLLGLPRDVVISPARKPEEAFVFCERGDGGVPGFAVPLLVDEDGDEAHEFFVEDQATGELQVSDPQWPDPAAAKLSRAGGHSRMQ